ncbi:tyrosine kinase, putative, partial [Entamoeba invadens IP1]|uniref:tyrosine kinase, putative n=1 Tax=Entamoeba invadens IP1 TaxID=370355 RepID=UPI0002C3D5CA
LYAKEDMRDAAHGIKYLHDNGVLHRDIKPDNILIFSFEDNIVANSKLTDFGSSRNINLMLTNMTFTSGIGTPVYMAPEVMFRKHYKKPADIYSFGITLLECFKWKEAYGGENFRYPWGIVDFITKGKRLEKPENVTEKVFELIKKCWCEEPKDRISIDEILDEFENM